MPVDHRHVKKSSGPYLRRIASCREETQGFEQANTGAFMFEGVVIGNLSRHTDSARVAYLDEAVIAAQKGSYQSENSRRYWVSLSEYSIIHDERIGAAVGRKCDEGGMMVPVQLAGAQWTAREPRLGLAHPRCWTAGDCSSAQRQALTA